MFGMAALTTPAHLDAPGAAAVPSGPLTGLLTDGLRR
jgi:hypothetical protein